MMLRAQVQTTTKTDQHRHYALLKARGGNLLIYSGCTDTMTYELLGATPMPAKCVLLPPVETLQ